MALSREIEKSKQHRVYSSKQSSYPSEKCCRTSSTIESIEGLAARDIEDKMLTLAYFLDVEQLKTDANC